MPNGPQGGTPPAVASAGVPGGRRWDECETEIVERLGELRRLATAASAGTAPAAGSAPTVTTSPTGGTASLVPVDVVRGSAGVWQAFWLHADLQARPDVDAVIPDLRPLADVLSGETADEWAELAALVAEGELRIRLVLPTAARTGAPRALVDQMVAAGIAVRTADEPSWFFVSSQGVAAAPVEWGATGDVDVAVLRGGALVGALAELFGHRWQRAAPWGDDGREDVLRLLARGLGDEDVARELSVSVRTVRRRVAEAMEAYGAATRFELGRLHALASPT